MVKLGDQKIKRPGTVMNCPENSVGGGATSILATRQAVIVTGICKL